jgi:hypothetical protein
MSNSWAEILGLVGREGGGAIVIGSEVQSGRIPMGCFGILSKIAQQIMLAVRTLLQEGEMYLI